MRGGTFALFTVMADCDEDFVDITGEEDAETVTAELAVVEQAGVDMLEAAAEEATEAT